MKLMLVFTVVLATYLFGEDIRDAEVQKAKIDRTSNLSPIKERSPAHTNSRNSCLLYTSPSPRDGLLSRMPSSA